MDDATTHKRIMNIQIIRRQLIWGLSLFAFFLSAKWFYEDRTYEPAIALVIGIIGLLSVRKHPPSDPEPSIPRVRKSILYIDDEVTRERVQMLEDSGYKVVPVSETNVALRKIEKQKYDLILLDVMMPAPRFISNDEVRFGYETGIYLAKKIKQSLNKTTPIIVITGNPNNDVEEQLIDVGIVEYFRKPINQDVLEDEIERALQ